MAESLHGRLLAAISAREERARRAKEIDLSGRWAIESGRTQSPAELSAVADFWQAETDASAVLRQTTRDRRVLQRHAPLKSHFFLPPLERCAYEWGDGDGWPVAWSACPAVVDLAEAYAVDLTELPGEGS